MGDTKENETNLTQNTLGFDEIQIPMVRFHTYTIIFFCEHYITLNCTDSYYFTIIQFDTMQLKYIVFAGGN